MGLGHATILVHGFTRRGLTQEQVLRYQTPSAGERAGDVIVALRNRLLRLSEPTVHNWTMNGLKLVNRTSDEPMPARQAAAEYGVDVCQLEYILTLAPAERLRRHDAALALVMAAREAGIRFYGFNPRSPEAPD